MDENNIRANKETINKYLCVASIIKRIEDHLRWSDFFFTFFNIAVFFLTINFLAWIFKRELTTLTNIDILNIFYCHVVGIFINAFWVASSMRLQLKLKLRYFQARFLERKMNQAGEFIFSDEDMFFNPEIRKVKSPDGEETVLYPTKGFLSMDGFIAASKPRLLLLLMPFIFLTYYLASFFYTLTTIF